MVRVVVVMVIVVVVGVCSDGYGGKDYKNLSLSPSFPPSRMRLMVLVVMPKPPGHSSVNSSLKEKFMVIETC